ncbi:hypothetical protein E2562_037691 [Oryza meyeriana var. granulata]|uniref:Uncharacterized protein n=1 Tax=Oryza meyeriana var. granulata TaxID=110450 RepID=A0A6G1ECQ7_9ORYZ|nr:hypothetical protein E2562_037691 [Oryza meyeriana var. granulata]
MSGARAALSLASSRCGWEAYVGRTVAAGLWGGVVLELQRLCFFVGLSCGNEERRDWGGFGLFIDTSGGAAEWQGMAAWGLVDPQWSKAELGIGAGSGLVVTWRRRRARRLRGGGGWRVGSCRGQVTVTMQWMSVRFTSRCRAQHG